MYKTFNNVELEEVYKKLSDVTDKYLFKLEYREKEENRFKEYAEVIIQGSNTPSKIMNLINGNSKVEYAAYGMENIDFKMNANGNITIKHSPNDGIVIEYNLTKDSTKILKLIFGKELQNA